MKITKVKAHTKRKKSGGVKNVRQHVRKTKTAAEKPGSGKALKVKKVKTATIAKMPTGATPPHAMPAASAPKFKSAIHARMAALRAMRKKK